MTQMQTQAEPRMVVGLDVSAVRADFPILQRLIHGKPLIFLDSAASSQKPLAVLDALEQYYRNHHANVHRGVYALSEEATRMYEDARTRLSRFVGACCPKEVIWTRNTTEAINLVVQSWGRANLQAGDHVLLTEMEHHSNIVPWQILSQERGFVVDFVRLSDDGTLLLDDLPGLLTPRTKMFAFTAMSNMLGTINPIRQLTTAAHDVGALVLVDGAQAVPHMPINVQDLGIDFLALSGHKMLGPTGVGALWGRRELLNKMPPFLGGGDMIKEVHLSGSTWNELPWKFEAGTPAIAEAIALGAAVDYLEKWGMEAIHRHEQELTAYALAQLDTVKGLRLLGPRRAEERGGLAAFTLAGVHPHDLAAFLDSLGIAIRAGLHCAQPAHERFGLSASARASFYLYNTQAEIDALVAGLRRAVEIFSF